MGEWMKNIVLIFIHVFIPTLLSQENLEIPVSSHPDEIIYHLAYTIGYSEEHEQARWVAYELSNDEVEGTAKRRAQFRNDPEVSTGSATLKDYHKSGFDRGHLAPTADMRLTEDYMSESFYMSNISPQVPGFNRGIWKKLEIMVRKMAVQNESIYVITGPIFEANIGKIGASRVTVPGFYYKVILDYEEPSFKAIGFILPNKKSSKPVSFYAVTVDEVEDQTGLDFFAKLPDQIENTIEGFADLRAWNLSPTSSK
jgi:endonuclease G, mitochondrial